MPSGPRPGDPGPGDPGPVHASLPAVYANDLTAQAFAAAIDAMLAPVDETLSRLPDNFDAFAARTELLPYLVRVSQARVEPTWPERAVRAAIDLAPWLTVHRGTPAALLREAQVVYGWKLTITDPGGVRLPGDALTWPADGTLYVDLEPELSGWYPVSYNQGSLERLVAAHVPASAPRILAPPAGKCALYEGPYWTGRALVISRDEPDLAASGFDNLASSAWNRTAGILGLYEDKDFGDSGSRQIVPAKQAVNVMESMNKRTSSVKFLTTVPAGSWGLLDADGNLLGVYDGDAANLEAGVGTSATSLVNNTIYTLEAFATQPAQPAQPAPPAQPGSGQVAYPGATTVLGAGVARALSSVTVHTQVPAGAFCLYELAQQRGRQWILWTQPGQSADLTAIGAAGSVSSVYNLTAATLELRAATDPASPSQFFYPSAFADVTTTGLTAQANLVSVLNGASAGRYCLYAGDNTKRQWVFSGTAGPVNLSDPKIAASNVVSSVQNLTSRTLELFKNDNGTGVSQLFYPGLTVTVTTAGLASLANSAVVYDGAPTGYYCLYASQDKSGNQWVFSGAAATVNLADPGIGAGNAASLVENNTTRTLALFTNNNGTGVNQLFYPGSTSAVTTSGLDKQAQSVTVYNGAPADFYCLSGGTPIKQWVFPATPGGSQDLASAGAANVATQVQNNSSYTIELFEQANGTGAYQLAYPKTDVAVTTSLWTKAKLVKCYNGPPNDYLCLYEGTNQTGTQWVFRSVTGTWDASPSQGWNDKVSSVRNLTQHTLQLFEHGGQGGRGELFYPGQNANANVSTINKLASSATLYDGCPDGYYCLFEHGDQGGKQYVLRATVGNVDLRNIGCNDMISSVRNLTNYTIQLWADPGPSGDWQLCYPTQNANVQSNLNDRTTIVQVHNGPPSGYYCLYEHGDGAGRQWLFSQSSQEVNISAAPIGAVGISSVRNNTGYTLELWSESNATGISQMFYPGLFTGADSGFNDKAKYARLHVINSANHSTLRSGYYALFEHENFNGLQWVFKAYSKVRLTDINAADKASSAANATSTKVTLYWNDNWTGWDYKVWAGAWYGVLYSGTENLNDHSRSVWST